MSEETAETPVEEQSEAAAPAEAAPAAPEASAAPAAEAPPEDVAGEVKKKKVNRMNLEEVNAAVKRTEQHMKGLNSKYAKALLHRKSELEGK